VSRTFFTDRDLGNIFPDVLKAAGLHVERHADHFAPTASDEEWLAHVGEAGWVALTHDARIRYKPNELAAVMQHRVVLLVIVGNAPHRELATRFVHSLPRIEAFLSAHDPPFIARVYRPSAAEIEKNVSAAGSVSLWFPS
jgi:predicted nuclease of predicted toxin-antitoxin system